MESTILKSHEFRVAYGCLENGDFSQAIALFARMRADHQSDLPNWVEASRWLASALERSEKVEDALFVLREIEVTAAKEHYDKPDHYFTVLNLLKKSGRLHDFQTYCCRIDGSRQSTDALDHLDWILLYVDTFDSPTITQCMRDILDACGSQLGLTVSDDLASTRGTVTRLVGCRNEANNRFSAFWLQLQTLISGKAARGALEEYVNAFVASEPCPVFREHALKAIVK
jgi:hypothetical protein